VAAFLANVGANSSHAARSPMFGDGSFVLVPIPERDPWAPPMLRVRDVAGLAEYALAAWGNKAIHFDPDLSAPTPTYGDNCRRAGRAFSLRRAAAGDVIVFLARLHPENSPPSFHLIGCLSIEDALIDMTADPGPGWWDCNAHVRRARATGRWDSFWVFKGTAEKSRAFPKAYRFARDEAESVFGRGWLWRPSRTELQTIGSYTRAVRRVDSPGEEWLRTICLS